EDVGNAIAVDREGSVYVAGYTRTASYGTGDFLLIKYDAQGDTVWVRLYNGPGDSEDEAVAVATDADGNVYVTGFSTGDGTGSDFATLRYSASGDLQWVRRYDGLLRDNDLPYAMAMDSAGNLYVAGESGGLTSFSDFLTIKYSPDGQERWVRRDSCLAIATDRANAVALDRSAARVFVTGTSVGNQTGPDYCTSCYEASTGDVVWQQRYNGPLNGGDEARAIAVDDQGNAYVTGYANDGPSTPSDYATLQYDPTGALRWVRTYNGTGNGDDAGEAMGVDSRGRVYVTGTSFGDTTDFDAATVAYDADGSLLWERRYNGEGNANDAPYALALDAAGNVYTTGVGGDYAVSRATTVAYTPEGTRLWVARSEMAAVGRDIGLDAAGSVYVTGNLVGYDPDCLTIKYAQTGDGPTAVKGWGDALPPRTLYLGAAYPNPFNAECVIPVASPAGGQGIDLAVYDILGRRLRTLRFGGLQAGWAAVVWDGRDEQGRDVASGIYLVALRRAGSQAVRTAVLAR
ncbi:MAG: SBBP repeat-containing protein, partial [Candidatus Latescibacterota bacterium]